MTKKRPTKKPVVLAPLSNAELHRRAVERLAAMTMEERIQTLVDAGILTKKLRLKKVYREAPLLSYRDPLPSRSGKCSE